MGIYALVRHRPLRGAENWQDLRAPVKIAQGRRGRGIESASTESTFIEMTLS
jgi:hypothetical protein